jgi:hypothetical protein
MKKIIDRIGKKRFRIMLGLILSGIVSVILALIIGVDDNPIGFLLCFAGMTTIILAFVFHWKKTRNYGILLVSSLIGFVVFAVLHNVLEAAGREMLGTVFFILALVPFLPAFTIGVIGILITSSRK